MFYELTLFSTYIAQRCVNVFNFVLTGTPAAVTGSFGLAHAFGAIASVGLFPEGSLFNTLREVTSSSVIFNQVRIKNPYDVTDFYSVPFAGTVTGEKSGESLSPAIALSLYSNQVRLDIQAGQKRFVGVPEADTQAGGILTSGALTAANVLAGIMSAPLTYDDEGNTLTYTLVVAKKYSDLEAEPPVINSYFPTLATQMDNVASGILWTARTYVSTQVTRQYGRGR